MIIKEEVGKKSCLKYKFSDILILGNGIYRSLWSRNHFRKTIQVFTYTLGTLHIQV